MSHASASAAITRTGKLRYDPSASDLYARNPAPTARFLPKKHDYQDSFGNYYYDVLKSEKLTRWARDSPLMDMVAPDMQAVSSNLQASQMCSNDMGYMNAQAITNCCACE